MKLTTIFLALTLSSTLALAQQDEVPKGIADSIGGSLRWTEGQFLTAAEAMPEAKYSFIPSAGEFKGVRSFAEQVKHVACANFAFFNEIEGKTPSPGLRKGRPRSRQNQGETGEVFTGFLRLRSPRTRHHQREERIGARRRSVRRTQHPPRHRSRGGLAHRRSLRTDRGIFKDERHRPALHPTIRARRALRVEGATGSPSTDLSYSSAPQTPLVTIPAKGCNSRMKFTRIRRSVCGSFAPQCPGVTELHNGCTK